MHEWSNCTFFFQYCILKSIQACNDYNWSNIMEWNWFFNKRCQRNITWSTSGWFSKFILIRSSANQNVSRINMKILFSRDDYHTKFYKAIFSQSLSIFQNNFSYVISNDLVIKKIIKRVNDWKSSKIDFNYFWLYYFK